MTGTNSPPLLAASGSTTLLYSPSPATLILPLKQQGSGRIHGKQPAEIREQQPVEIRGQQPAAGVVLTDPHALGEVGEPHASGEVAAEEHKSREVGVDLQGDVYERFYSCRQCWASKCRGL
jgi:hypothetical protein